ncbi:MAG: hypothetical protein U5P10_09820 [Spirochaetia bacterium]|nr:hypothetical protein [Spirochaetia bacterium]
MVTEVKGGEEARLLKHTIDYGEKKALLFEEQESWPGGGHKQRVPEELGIGLNPSGTITGHMLEDEKAYNTCHIAIGSNYDNDAPALIHLDCLIRLPTMIVEFADGSFQILLKERDCKQKSLEVFITQLVQDVLPMDKGDTG